MSTIAAEISHSSSYPVNVDIAPTLEQRNRLTTGFRILLAIPHLLLVGGPMALILSWTAGTENIQSYDWSAGGGALGAVAAVAAIIAWFAIVFTGRHPQGLWALAAFYLRWRVRAVAYVTMLRDEYPPFGDGVYPAALVLVPPVEPRNRLTVAFRIFLALPHIIVLWFLGLAWALTSIVAWFAILFTGKYPAALYDFAVGVLRWNIRVEAYLLLLVDEYPVFSFD
jgi:hypothetical protein